MSETTLNLDYETKSELDLTKVGLDRYSAHPSTEILMAGYAFNGGEIIHWDHNDGRMPSELKDALLDPHVKKWAFNAQFERVITRRVAKINTPTSSWRCTMALAYMMSFFGGLDMVAKQIGMPLDKQKGTDGSRLIRLFSMPQKITKANPHIWRNRDTNPDDWDLFCGYNVQDVITEMAALRRLIRFPNLDIEWAFYELDQKINDRGLPIDMQLVNNAIWMAAKRKEELTSELKEITHLANPNSPAQLTKWLKARGYPFSDLAKDTVKKVLKEFSDEITPDAVAALKLRRQVARTSVKKYDAFLATVGPGDRFRFGYQFAGASRTNRFAGRKVQTHNLSRTPKALEPEDGDDTKLVMVTDAMRNGEYDFLSIYVEEPMDALAGCVRSAIRAPDDYELRACDLSSIETVVIAWLSGCETLLNVFREGRCAYREFGTHLFDKAYHEITKAERGFSKAPVLGCGFRLGGGDLKDGKRTGLWGYAEGMGIDMTREQAHKAVAIYRDAYVEVCDLWKTLERAVERCVKSGKDQTVGPLRFEYRKPFMMVWLPSGRPMYYYQPRIERKEFIGRATIDFPDGEPYFRNVFSYMGKGETGNIWTRITSHGGKLVENFVQAIARDLLRDGMIKADRNGFILVGHVHDEQKTLHRIDDDVHTLELLRECMITASPWASEMPLNAVPGAFKFYRKD